MKPKHQCLHEEELNGLNDGMIDLKAKLGNGLNKRVERIEKLQYWQMGVMVGIIGIVIFGLWYFTTRTLDANSMLLDEVRRMLAVGAGHVR